ITVRYTDKVNFHMSNKYDQPLPNDWIANKGDCSASEEDALQLETYYNIQYRSCTGALIYLHNTRPDITFAVMKLVKFNINPGRVHFEALLHLLGYIRDHPYYGLRFYSNVNDSPVTKLLYENKIGTLRSLLAFSDSSWQDCPTSGRSTGSFLIYYQGGVVDHALFVPDPVALSSGKAEYNTACATSMAVAHLRMLTNEMDTLGDSDYKNQPLILIVLDNISAICMGKSFKDTEHTRHIMRRYHYVRQGIKSGLHELKWISKDVQLADNGTKNLTRSEAKPRNDCILVTVPE
ncbi:MAG: Ty1/Copia family ribonuclease HI, partial [Gaiellaceae bacterium]